MCRFKKTNIFTGKRDSLISIHLMCRFKEEIEIEYNGVLAFQYILCVGSRSTKSQSSASISDISIHLMCRFKYGW